MKKHIQSSTRTRPDAAIIFLSRAKKFVKDTNRQNYPMDGYHNSLTEIASQISAENPSAWGEHGSDEEDWLADLMVAETQSLPRVKQLRALISMSRSRKETKRNGALELPEKRLSMKKLTETTQ